MATETTVARPLEFGRVVENTFYVLGKSPWVYLGLSALFVGVPSLIGAVALAHLKQTGAVPEVGRAASLVQLWISALAGLFSYPALAGAYVTAVAQLDGRRVAFGEAVAAGVRFWLPLFAVSLVAGLGVSLGLVLLIVPGVILMLMWLLAGPAMVLENLQPTAALGRSQRLTRGRRWSILGLLLLLLVGGLIIALLFGLFSGVLWGIIRMAGSGLGLPRYAAIAPFVTVLVQIAVFPLHAAGYACIYAEARGRGGASPQTVAETFT